MSCLSCSLARALHGWAARCPLLGRLLGCSTSAGRPAPHALAWACLLQLLATVSQKKKCSPPPQALRHRMREFAAERPSRCALPSSKRCWASPCSRTERRERRKMRGTPDLQIPITHSNHNDSKRNSSHKIRTTRTNRSMKNFEKTVE